MQSSYKNNKGRIEVLAMALVGVSMVGLDWVGTAKGVERISITRVRDRMVTTDSVPCALL